MKKRISLILVFAMLMSLIVPFAIPTASAAASAITDQSELFAWDGTGSRYLANDITISGTWNYSAIIYGTFDGQGHTITFADGATINGGLFQNVAYGATIKNLNVVQAGSATWKMVYRTASGIYNSANCIGGLIAGIYGVNENTTDMYVENVTVTANINVTEAPGGEITVGGITGQIRNTYAHLTNCTFNGSITDTTVSHSTNSAFGGIVGMTVKGKTKAILTNCLNNGNVTAYCNVGGIVGWSRRWDSDSIKALIIQECVNRGAVTCSGNAYAGGIIAYISGSGNSDVQTYILNNINYGSVNITYASTSYPAGICGYLQYGSKAQNQINGNVNYGTLSATSGTAAPILNRLTDGEVNCAAEKNYAVTYDTGTYHTKFADSSAGANTVVTALNGTYNGVSVTYVVNSGKVLVLWDVTSPVEFSQMDTNGAYVLKNDITISGTWNFKTIFRGYFDGGNHTVTFANGTIIKGGLFQNVSYGATIKNLKVVQAGNATWNMVRNTVSGIANSENGIGGLVASIYGHSNETDINIQNITVTANITVTEASGAEIAVGGIVGQVKVASANITNCTFNGSIKDTTVNHDTNSAFGGIVGFAMETYKVEITQCINNAAITAYSNVGGIFGFLRRNNDATAVRKLYIKQCINNGPITCRGNAYAGGIVAQIISKATEGYHYHVLNNINYGNVKITYASTSYPAGICSCLQYGSDGQNQVNGNVNYGILSAASGTPKPILSTASGTVNCVAARNYAVTYATGTYHTNFADSLAGATTAVTNLNSTYSSVYFKNGSNRVALAWTQTGVFQTLTKYVGYQLSDISNGTRNIRFIGGYTDSDRYQADRVGLEIMILSDSVGKSFADSSTQIYGYVVAAGVKKSAAECSSNYLYTAVVKGIPTNIGSAVLMIRPFYQLGSETYYGDYTFVYNFNIATAT